MSKLDNWTVCFDNKEKDVHFHLMGEIFNDSRFDNGRVIRTSRVIKIENNIASTKSGTEYQLGFPKHSIYTA